jgi:hypothetical protein
MQLDLMKGRYAWQDEPGEDTLYTAGIDVAGEERPNADGTPSKTRDSTIIKPKRSYTDERRYEEALYTGSRTCATWNRQLKKR